MKPLSILFAALLGVMPAMAFASECSTHANMTCADGKVWDDTSKTCVAASS